MTSIGFKSRSYRGGPPPVCHKPPMPGPQTPPGKPAWKLHAFVKWYSEEPGHETNQTDNIAIPWNPFSNRYHGPVIFHRPMIRVTAWQVPTTDNWHLTLIVWDTNLNGKYCIWRNTFIDPKKPFDSHLLTHAFTGYINHQQLRLML